MEHLKNNKFYKIAFIIFVALLLLSLLGVTAYADVKKGDTKYTLRFSDYEAESGNSVTDFGNYATEHEYFGQVNHAWALSVIEQLLAADVIRGVKTTTGDLYLPADNYITHKDAFGITLFYYWGDTYNGNFTKRHTVYKNSGKYLDKELGLEETTFETMAAEDDNNVFMTRGKAALLLAYCLQETSKNENGEYKIKLSDYSAKGFGYLKTGQTIDNYDNGYIYPNGKSDPNSDKDKLKISDLTETNNLPSEQIQALTLLADIGINQGRQKYSGEGETVVSTGTVEMAGSSYIQYNEYYAWLAKATPDEIPERIIERKLPDLYPALTLEASDYINLNYSTILYNNQSDLLKYYQKSYDYSLDGIIDVTADASDTYVVNPVSEFSLTYDLNVIDKNTNVEKSQKGLKDSSYTSEFTYLKDAVMKLYSYENNETGFLGYLKSQLGGSLSDEYYISIPIEYHGGLTAHYGPDYGTKMDGLTWANAKSEIKIYNQKPFANFTYSTSTGVFDKDIIENYPYFAEMFYYATQPISIKDTSEDPEERISEIKYTISRISTNGGGGILGEATFEYKYTNNTPTITKSTDRFDTNRTYLGSFNANTQNGISLNATFLQSGTYRVYCTVIDELGKTDSYYQDIIVGEKPQAPTAKIKGLSYSYQNRDTVFTDASTDPNNDIVKWVWTSGEKPSDVKTVEYIEYKEENSDTWRTAIAGEDEDYEITGGTSCIRAYSESQAAASERAAVTINFKHLGTYRLHLKVTDATGLTDETYHDVQIIEGYPVPVPEVVNPPANGVTYTVTFIDAQDGVTTVKEIPAGTYLEAKQVPDKKTCEGYTVYGWTLDNASIVDPTTVQINGNLTFRVIKAPTSSDTNIHTVTFINTDGTITSLKVPDKSKIEERYIPEIVNLPDVNELGWIQEIGGSTITKSEIADITVTKDLLFWVLTEPLSSVKHQVMFINTDGTVTKFSVPHEGNISASQIPEIIDLPNYIESDNWICSGTSASMTVDEITKMQVRQDLVFWVNKTPIGTNNHLVTFINSDGEKTTVVVPDGGNIPLDSIPEIKDIPGQTENGWTKDGENVTPEDKLDEITSIEVTTDLTFWVDVTPDTGNYTVTFINTDGSVTRLIVPKADKGEPDKKISEAISGEIPTIVDDPDYTENGWVQDNGTKVYTPEEVAEIKVDRDMVFTVDLSPAPNNLTVTFINTDGTVTIETMPYNTEISSSDVPEIVDLPKFTEYGWTLDGDKIAYPIGTVVTKNLVFWVLKDPIQDSHTVTFINTDGSTTVLIVPDGEKISSKKTEGDIPEIIDIPGLTERGWTEDGTNIISEDKIGDIKVTRDMVFWVYTDPEYPSQTQTHTVTFINTDDTVTILYVVDGQKISTGGTIPTIKNLEGVTENGWTQDGTTIIPESEIDTIKNMTVTKDLVFWVDTNTTDPDYPYDGAYFDDEGRLIIKQNRKVMLDLSNSITPDGDSIKWDETDIKIYTEGGITKISNVILEDKDYYSQVLKNINADDTSTYFKGLDTENDSIYNNMGFAFMCKETGEFKIKVKLHNAYTEDNHDGDNTPNNVTITVVVVADEPPEVELYVNNANPNFDGYKIENGQIKDSTNVMISSSASSPDGDYIDETKYKWEVLKRTRTATSNYSANYTEDVTNNLTSKSVSVKSFKADFKEKQTGEYLAKLTVTEKFGAPTIEKVGNTTVITDKDYLSNSAQKEFEVNWIPRIRYNLDSWTYI